MLDVDALAAMLAPVIAEEVDKATAPLNARIAELEARKPEAGPPGEKGDPGERGEDGVGIAGALIDRTGALVLTLSDGSTRELGQVVGRDGINAAVEFKAGELSDEEYEAKVLKLLSVGIKTAVEETGRESANDAHPALTTEVLEHDDG